MAEWPKDQTNNTIMAVEIFDQLKGIIEEIKAASPTALPLLEK